MNPSNVSPPSGSPDFGSSPSSGGTLHDKAQELKSQASQSAQSIKQKVSETAAQLKDDAVRAADERKRTVADRIGGYSSAIHNSAKNFEEQDPNIAWFTHEAANRLQSVADYVRQRDFQQLKVDAENVARRHPAVLIGGSFVVGLLLGSLLRAGGSAAMEESSERDSDYDYDPETTPGEAYTTTTPVVSESSEI